LQSRPDRIAVCMSFNSKSAARKGRSNLVGNPGEALDSVAIEGGRPALEIQVREEYRDRLSNALTVATIAGCGWRGHVHSGSSKLIAELFVLDAEFGNLFLLPSDDIFRSRASDENEDQAKKGQSYQGGVYHGVGEALSTSTAP
ncbi:MAG: hypothetical protein R3282_07275, partial [Rhodothermales bacterium]|nr:hypothetical protein [Rhodothermales bacterium]